MRVWTEKDKGIIVRLYSTNEPEVLAKHFKVTPDEIVEQAVEMRIEIDLKKICDYCGTEVNNRELIKSYGPDIVAIPSLTNIGADIVQIKSEDGSDRLKYELVGSNIAWELVSPQDRPVVVPIVVPGMSLEQKQAMMTEAVRPKEVEIEDRPDSPSPMIYRVKEIKKEVIPNLLESQLNVNTHAARPVLACPTSPTSGSFGSSTPLQATPPGSSIGTPRACADSLEPGSAAHSTCKEDLHVQREDSSMVGDQDKKMPVVGPEPDRMVQEADRIDVEKVTEGNSKVTESNQRVTQSNEKVTKSNPKSNRSNKEVSNSQSMDEGKEEESNKLLFEGLAFPVENKEVISPKVLLQKKERVKSNSSYTPEEIEIVKKNWQGHTAKEIAGSLGRSVGSVKMLGKRLGLKKNNRMMSLKDPRVADRVNDNINIERFVKELGPVGEEIQRELTSNVKLDHAKVIEMFIRAGAERWFRMWQVEIQDNKFLGEATRMYGLLMTSLDRAIEKDMPENTKENLLRVRTILLESIRKKEKYMTNDERQQYIAITKASTQRRLAAEAKQITEPLPAELIENKG